MSIKNLKIFLITIITIQLFSCADIFAADTKNNPTVEVKELKLPEIVIRSKDETLITDTHALLIPPVMITSFKREPVIKIEGEIKNVKIDGEKGLPLVADPGCFYSNCCTSLISQSIKGDEGYYKSAEAKYVKGDYNGAYELYSNQVKYHPQGELAGDAYYWIAEINYRHYNRIDEAKKFYEVVTTNYPKAKLLNYAYYSLAFINFNEKDYESAGKNATESFNAKPKGELAEVSLIISALSSYYLAENEEALKKCDDIFKLFPETKFAPLITYIKGNIYFTLENFDKAKKEFLTFNEKYKESEYLNYNLYGLGMVYSRQGLIKDSIAPNEELILKFPKFPFIDVVMYNLIKAYNLTDQIVKASAMTKKLEVAVPRSRFIDHAYFDIAYRFYLNQEYEEVRKRLLEFIEAFPLSPLKDIAYFMLAGAEFNLARYVDAVKRYELYLESGNNIGLVKESMLNIAYAYYIDGLYKEAAHALEKVIFKYGPDYEKINEVRYFLGESYYKMTDYEKAANIYSKIDVKDEYYPRAILGLGWIKFTTGEFAEAIELFNKFLKMNPDASVPETHLVIAESYFNLKDYDNALEHLKIIIKDYGDSNVISKTNFLMGLINFKKGDYKMAVVQLSSVVDGGMDEDYADDSKYWLGWSYFQIGQYDSAADEFTKLATDFPDSPFTPKAILKIGDCYYNLERFTSAKLSYKSIIDKAPGTNAAAAAEYGIIQILYSQKEHDSFITAGEEFIKKYPDNQLSALVFSQLAEHYLEKSDFANASRVYEDMAKAHPKSELADDALYKSARIAFETKDYNKAMVNFLAVLKDYPESNLIIENNYSLAETYFNLKKYEDAIKFYDMTAEKSDDTDMIKDSRNKASKAFLLLKDPTSAANELIRSAEKFRDDPFDRKLYIQVGDIYFDRGDYDSAITFYKKGLDSKYKGVGVSAQMKIADTFHAQKDFETALLEYLKIIYLHKQEKDYIDDAYLKIGQLYLMMGKVEEAKKIFLRLQNESLNPDKIGVAIEKLRELGVNE